MRWRRWVAGWGIAAAGGMPAAQAASAPPLTLAEAFARSARQSETLAMKAEEIAIAQARYRQALGSALPHLAVHVSETLQDTPGGGSGDGSVANTFTRRSRPEVAVNLQQPLFQGLRELRAAQIAGADRRRADATLARAMQLLYFDVATAYDGVLQLERELAILRAARTILQARVAELYERVRLGKSRATEALTTEATLAATDAAIERTRGLVAVARELLGFLVGAPIPQRLVEEPYREAVREPGTAARPDVAAARAQAELARGKVAYEKASRLPTLKLESNYYPYRVGFQEEIRWDLLFALKVPFFQGGGVRGKVREAEAGYRQAALAHTLAARQASLEVRQAMAQRAAAIAQERALTRAVRKAEANVGSLTEEYRLGLVNNLEVLHAMKDLHERRLEAARAHFEVRRSLRELFLAQGTLPTEVHP